MTGYTQLYANSSGRKSSEPTIVRVGMYINRIENVNVKTQTFDCEFYLWLWWKGDCSPLNVEWVNGSNMVIRLDTVETDSAGVKSYSAKVSGTFHADLDVSRFPRDYHRLYLEMENFDYPEDSVRFVIDSSSIGKKQIPVSGGWRSTQATAEVRSDSFEVANRPYSHYEMSVRIERVITPFVIKVFLPMIIVVAMSMLAFYLPAKELGAQLSLGSVALLSIIALHLQVADKLPDVGYFTDADILMMGSYVFIFLALAETVVANALHTKLLGKAPSKLDRICRWAFPSAYIVFITVIALI